MKKMYIPKLIVLLLIICFSCNSKAKKIGSKISHIDSVAAWVADCYFLEGEISVKHWEIDVKDYSLVKYESFFAKHGLTKETFERNVKYYILSIEHSEIFMEKVSELVEQRAQLLRDSIQ